MFQRVCIHSVGNQLCPLSVSAPIPTRGPAAAVRLIPAALPALAAFFVTGCCRSTPRLPLRTPLYRHKSLVASPLERLTTIVSNKLPTQRRMMPFQRFQASLVLYPLPVFVIQSSNARETLSFYSVADLTQQLAEQVSTYVRTWLDSHNSETGPEVRPHLLSIRWHPKTAQRTRPHAWTTPSMHKHKRIFDP